MGSTGSERLLAWNIYVTRKAGQSQADHHAHLTNVNSPIIVPLLKKYGAVSYSVVHNDETVAAEEKRLNAPAIEAGQDPSNMKAAWDTVISIRFRDIEVVEKLRADPEFIQKFMPDHFNFADMAVSKSSLGWVEEYVF